MGQTPETRTEARTETTTLGIASSAVPVGLEAIAKKMKGGDNKTAVLHLGEDSATPFTLEAVLTVGGESATFVESGHIEVGASYTRAQTTAFPVAKALHMALGVMGAHNQASCRTHDPEVRFVTLETMPPAITHELICEWNEGFRMPTVVRNAFNNTMGCAFDYLDDAVEIKTKLGKLGGFNEQDKTLFTWKQVRETLERKDNKIYGSFGYGTGNSADVHNAAIRTATEGTRRA